MAAIGVLFACSDMPFSLRICFVGGVSTGSLLAGSSFRLETGCVAAVGAGGGAAGVGATECE